MDTVRHQFSDWVTGDATLGVVMAGEGMYTEPTQWALERKSTENNEHGSLEA